MKVNYTLPGLLPESTGPAMETGERPPELFSAHLQRLRAPEIADWRTLLRLGVPPSGARDLSPPLAPIGIALRDGAAQRSWWRGVLGKQIRSLETGRAEETSDQVSVRRMLDFLLESQRNEDEVFARHFAESGD